MSRADYQYQIDEISEQWRYFDDQMILIDHYLTKENAMPDIGQMIQSKYLKGSDIPDPVIVTIRGVKQVNISREDQQPELKWLIKFAEYDKPMVLNATNMRIAAKVLGSTKTEDWTGKEIVLFFDENVTFGNELVGGLRFKRKEPEPRKLAPKPANKFDDMPDDIPWEDEPA